MCVTFSWAVLRCGGCLSCDVLAASVLGMSDCLCNVADMLGVVVGIVVLIVLVFLCVLRIVCALIVWVTCCSEVLGICFVVLI